MDCGTCGEDLTEYRSFPDAKIIDGGSAGGTPDGPAVYWGITAFSCPGCGAEYEVTDSN